MVKDLIGDRSTDLFGDVAEQPAAPREQNDTVP
jgi:hypothetical protein